MVWAELVGGLGLFLLGMGFLTDGLEASLGTRVKSILRRVVGRPLRAFASGAVTTAMIQSSSATSLIAIGLVAAGLVGLADAIALIIGANVGTTVTAYIVALVGLKFSVSTVALPLVGIGGLARAVLRGPQRLWADLVLGFGLLFVGIDLMQASMADAAAQIDVGAWGGRGILAALVLVLIGTLMTILTQSSSAAMATTLAAVAVGTVDLRSAAFLVIGQNLGTTTTAVVGSLGTVADGKRLAVAHVIFNVGTGAIALILISPMLMAATWLAGNDAALSLAFFHTMFNLLGAIVFMPWTRTAARLLERAVPARTPGLLQHLGAGTRWFGAAAAESVRMTLLLLLERCMHLMRSRLSPSGPGRQFERQRLEALAALESLADYMSKARTEGWSGPSLRYSVQAADHMRHILVDLADDIPVQRLRENPRLVPFEVRVRALLDAIGPTFASDDPVLHEELESDFEELVVLRKQLRTWTLEHVAEPGGAGVIDARADLDASHWADRLLWHLRRAVRTIRKSGEAAGSS